MGHRFSCSCIQQRYEFFLYCFIFNFVVNFYRNSSVKTPKTTPNKTPASQKQTPPGASRTPAKKDSKQNEKTDKKAADGARSNQSKGQHVPQRRPLTSERPMSRERTFVEREKQKKVGSDRVTEFPSLLPVYDCLSVRHLIY